MENFNIVSKNICSVCGKKILVKGKDGMCENCYDEMVYKEAKEYILNTNATAVEVATKFDIPLSKVNKWVTEGRLEYRKNNID